MAEYRLLTLTPTPLLARLGQTSESIRFSKQLAVLVYLAARPSHRASREELIGLLWGGTSVFDGRQALRQIVYQIRRAFGADLLGGEEILALRAGDITFDVAVFREWVDAGKLEEALLVYEADFLASVSLPGAREFEQWAEGLRQQLAAERRQVLRTLMVHRADAGHYREAAEFARQLAEADPANFEPRVRQLEFLALAGDTARCAAVAAELRGLSALGEGYAVPGDVESAIARALAPVAPAGRDAGNGYPSDVEMVGRAEEYRRVVDVWRGALEGRGGAVLLTGEAGIGKSRFAGELVRRFRRDGGVVGRAACFAIEQSEPLAPFLEVLRELSGARGLMGATPGCLQILAALVPEIADRFRDAVVPRPLPIAAEAVALSVLDAFAAIADDAPFALIVEDLHWAARGTVEFAHRLARRAPATRLFMLATSRDFAGGREGASAARELVRSGAVREIPLGPLEVEEVEQLLGSVARMPEGGAGPALVRRIHEWSDGIPLYVLELMKSLHDAGALDVRDGVWWIREDVSDPSSPLPLPETAEGVLNQRLTTLGDAAHACLAALGVVGRSANAHEVARIAGLTETDCIAALAALERRHLAMRGGERESGWIVAHDEIAEVVLRSIAPAFRELLHARAADLAEERAGMGWVGGWSVAARHAALAGDVARAARDAARAGSAAEAVSGPHEGARVLRGVLDACPAPVREEMLRSLGRAADGRWSPSRWLEERDGTRRRRRLRYALLAVAGAVTAVAAAVSLRAVLASPPLGGGFIAVAEAGIGGAFGRAEHVRAYALDEDLDLREVSTDSLPPGLRAGFAHEQVRPDQGVALWSCGRPDLDPTAVCAEDLRTGRVWVIASDSVGDSHAATWLPDASGFVLRRGYETGEPPGYAYALYLADSVGRIVRPLARDARPYHAALVSPHGDRLLAAWNIESAAQSGFLSLDGRWSEAPDWCRSGRAAWSPDGASLACAVPTMDGVTYGPARRGSRSDTVTVEGSVTGMAWSPDSRYVIASVADDAAAHLVLIDTRTGRAYARLRTYRGRVEVTGWSVARRAARVTFRRERITLGVGSAEPVDVEALDDASQRVALLGPLRWSVLDTSVAHVDTAGVLTADRPGETWLVARLGAARPDSCRVEVLPAASRVVLREDFEGGLDTARWKPWGWPLPQVLDGRGRGGSRGFFNGGDRSSGSGVALRQRLDLARGLTVEYWSRVPFTRPNWQGAAVHLFSIPADSFHAGRGSPAPAGVASLGAMGPWIDGASRSITLNSADDTHGSELPARLADGRWHRYRLVAYPSGELRLFADGAEVLPPVRSGPNRLLEATLTLEGRSVGTFVMMDDVTVWEGVVLDPPVRPEPAALDGRASSSVASGASAADRRR